MMMSFVDIRVTFVLRILIGLFGKRTCVASNQIPFPVSRYPSMNLARAYLRKELNVTGFGFERMQYEGGDYIKGLFTHMSICVNLLALIQCST
jgi:hypothetical protein